LKGKMIASRLEKLLDYGDRGEVADGSMDGDSEDDEGDDGDGRDVDRGNNEEEDGMAMDADAEKPRFIRNRPLVGSYKKKACVEAATREDEKYKERKLNQFETGVDNLCRDALSPLISSPPDTCVDDTPRTITNKERGAAALNWALHKLVPKHLALGAHLLREKRTIQEAEETAVARIRKHWEDRSLGLLTRYGMTHKAWQTNINLASHT